MGRAVNVLYFAWVRQKTGTSGETVEADAATVRALAEHLRARGGGYAEAFADLARLRAAVNQEHVPFDAAIAADDEIAFFPPVTGG
ncbi:MAG: molybdopterin converting factor subunit 1 [Alphaproteobacteria bacterium]|nr:molybdopterin converting factor subunit 1 [Alphaproteobacteria bacterium]